MSKGLVIEHRKGRYLPILVCECCGEQIEDYSMGGVVWKRIQKEGGRRRALVLCKKNDCLNTEPYKKLQWQDLPKFLMRLLHNSGLNTEKELRRSFSDAKQWDAMQ